MCSRRPDSQLRNLRLGQKCAEDGYGGLGHDIQKCAEDGYGGLGHDIQKCAEDGYGGLGHDIPNW